MSAGSSRWYQICERLGRAPTPTYVYASSTSLAVRLRVDVHMADAASPFAIMASPQAGQKRARDDAEVDDESVARGLRYEKVCQHDPGTPLHHQSKHSYRKHAQRPATVHHGRATLSSAHPAAINKPSTTAMTSRP